ncbi:amidohydrolase family protein [Nakamurella endophytica]|uniref:Metal-dependent hydrolase n=1 Tax=Nakamurella endophytica TaxID=1748367 RepID=A0A917WDM3_9ACTN|nr:amidohydrolase family protein [Nakamurella endophytica]GGL94697.1 metal-dependent hydrolase [Nakamurella endophytica]
MIIDAHHHLWDRSRARYPFLSGVPEIDRDVDMTDLRPLLQRCGVDRTVVVQGVDSDADTDFLFEQAAGNAEIAAVVAWVPLDRPEEAARRLDELAVHPSFAGIRAGINWQPDPEWILRPDVSEGLELLADRDIPFDLVSVRRRHLELVPELVERHPRLRVVIDHISKPPVGKPDREPWWTNLVRAARYDTVHAKLSGIFPARPPMDQWTVTDLQPFVDHAVEAFGTSRLMWGSDWPIVDLAGGYERMFDALLSVFEQWPAADRGAVLGGTAARFYGIPAAVTA